MKALPKRKGNSNDFIWLNNGELSLNESPSQKEGKSLLAGVGIRVPLGLNESPSQKEGKSKSFPLMTSWQLASMKALPKRKGNSRVGSGFASRSGPQ